MGRVFGVSALPFVACIALLVAETFQILSFAAPYWASDARSSFGLWRILRCESAFVACFQYEFQWDVPAWHNAVRGLESIAIILIAIPIVVVPVYIYVSMGLYYRSIFITMTIMAFLASICNIVGVIIYGITIGSNSWAVGWCLITCICGAVFDIIGFIILLIAAINRPDFHPETFYNTTGLYVDPDTNKLYAIEGEEKDFIKTDVSTFGGIDNPVVSVRSVHDD